MKKIVFSIFLVSLLFLSCSSYEKKAIENDQDIHIYPEYKQTTIPFNIAPLNFMIEEIASTYIVNFSNDTGDSFSIKTKNGKIKIPRKKWKKLLTASVASSIKLDIYIKQEQWKHFPSLTFNISEYPIDTYMSYRLIFPQTGSWKKMGLYERNLTNFKQRTIIENSSLDNSCVNCHHVSSNNANNFMFHARAGKAGGTYIAQGKEIRKLAPKIYDLYKGVGYASWHPNGEFIVFSANSVNGRDVNQSSIHLINGADSKSDLLVYDIKNNAFYTDSSIFNDRYWETYPTWAADGKTIYFCRAKKLDAKNHDDLSHIQYNLMKIEFDIETHQWSEPELVIDAVSLNRSIAFPRISPDGRYLMFTLYDYGVFSIFRKISDLAMYDIQQKTSHLISSLNTNEAESYHSWSSNGKWVLFSSKYPDGECGHPHIAAFDPISGTFSTSFVLPQRDPAFYKRFLLSFNIPELYNTASKIRQFDLIKASKQDALPASVKDGPGTKNYREKKNTNSSLWRAG